MNLRFAVVALAALPFTGCWTTTAGGTWSDPGEVPVVYGETLGTHVGWEADHDVAFARAKAEGKLVLMLHLSGNFESFEDT